MSEIDNWDKIMKAATASGFIVMAYGGIAVVMTHEEQKAQGIYDNCQYMAGLSRVCPEQNKFDFQLVPSLSQVEKTKGTVKGIVIQDAGLFPKGEQ